MIILKAHQSHFNIKIIMKIKQSDQPATRSQSNPREHRLQLTKITENLPYGEFFAYCIVSKQSSNGLMVHQRLLSINTYSKQLSYYEKIPSLPLQSLKALSEPKQVVNYQTASRFQFVLERIRIGHVNVRWYQKNQPKSWKLIVGSNKLAQELLQILLESSGRRIDGSRKKREETESKQKIKVQQQNSNAQVLNQQTKKDVKMEIKVTQFEQAGKKPLQQLNLASGAKPNRPEIYSPISLDNQISQQISRNKARVDPQYISISINRVENSQPSQKKNYPKFDSLIQKKQQKQSQSKQKSQSLANQWFQATSSQQKAAIYLRFVTKCKKKIQLIMQNFFASHLQHQQQDNMCVLYDGETKYYYCPLVQNLQNEGAPQDLTRKILEEELYFREFQCLDYFSSIDRVGQTKILVPMACIISFKAMRFYCKNTLDLVNSKSQITRDMSNYQLLINQLEQKSHLKFNGEEEIYEIIRKDKATLIILNRIRCLPQISPNLPISRQYIQSYITQGIVSGQKDIKAIKTHSLNLISKDLIQILSQRHLFSCFQMMTMIQKLGLSFHYLPLIIQQPQLKKLHYFYRVLQSEILAKAMQWEIRRKMQIQIFKKRQFGFSVNQFKMSVNMLFQEQKYYLRLLSKIINSYFGFTCNFQVQTIQSNLVAEMTLASLLHKLGLSCKVDIQHQQYKGWIWKEINIADRIDVIPRSQVITYNSRCYHDKKQSFLQKSLTKQLNFQIQDTELLSVLSYLGVQKDRNGLYLISPSYQLLNQNVKAEVNYYLSHFLTPSHGITPINVLQSTIYLNIEEQQHFQNSFQYLILLNKIRWLIKEGFKLKAQELIQKQVKKAELWNQSLVLIQIYDFYSKFKFKFGEISQALELSLRSLKIALQYYQQVSTIQAELLIAEQAFQAANFHLLTQDFTKSLDLFSIAQKIIKNINTAGDNITLNPEFILLYARKCQIFLIFGQYQNCLDECLEGLECCKKFKHYSVRLFVDENEFKIYEVLFRCYQTKNMRKQMIEVANICSEKYFQDKVKLNQPIDENLLSEVVKLAWISIVKEVEVISPISERLDTQIEDLKYIYLKKVHKELLLLGKKLKFQYRYNRKEVTQYFKRSIVRKSKSKSVNLLKHSMVDCLASITMSSQGFRNDKLYEQESLQSPWLMLQGIACMTSYQFLIGIIQNSLHIYTFQY